MGKIGGDDGGYAFGVGNFRRFDPAGPLTVNDFVQFPFSFMDMVADFTTAFYPYQVAAEFSIGLFSGDQVAERDPRESGMVMPGQILNGYGLPHCEDVALLNGLQSVEIQGFELLSDMR